MSAAPPAKDVHGSTLGIPAEWLAEFEAAARRPLRTRFRYAFIKTYKPVLDDETFRSFDSTAGVPPVVRGEPSGLARLWARLSTARPRRSGTRSPATESATSSSASPGRSFSAFRTRRRTPTSSSTRRRRTAERIVAALREIGFSLTDPQAAEIESGKDFVQLKNGPFDLDLVFAPDGIERFADAWARRVEVEGFTVCHLDDIIASKEASGRVKDRESLPRLRSFREYWKQRRPS